MIEGITVGDFQVIDDANHYILIKHDGCYYIKLGYWSREPKDKSPNRFYKFRLYNYNSINKIITDKDCVDFIRIIQLATDKLGDSLDKGISG